MTKALLTIYVSVLGLLLTCPLVMEAHRLKLQHIIETTEPADVKARLRAFEAVWELTETGVKREGERCSVIIRP